MGTRKIKDAVDLTTNEKIYLRGHAKATYMSSGESVEDTINNIIINGGGGGGGEGALTEAQIAAMGFTKNKGTITEVKMNGVSKGTNGTVDLGTVITEHQDISGKQDEITDLANIRSGASKGATALQYYVTTFDMFDIEGKIDLSNDQVNKGDLIAAIRDKKLILMPIYKDVSNGGFIVLTCDIDDLLYIDFTYDTTHFHVETDCTDTESGIYADEISFSTLATQNDISDLDDIRANAALGATALQEHQPIKTIFGQEIVGEGDVFPDYSMKITAAGEYTVNSIGNPRIQRGDVIYPLVVGQTAVIQNGPTLNVRISSDGTLNVSGSIVGPPIFYLASAVLPEEYTPISIAKLDDIKQSDYDESDPNSKAYIKNRTHYFKGYNYAQQLVADDTTIGTNLADVGEYFKLGNAVYKSADMVGVEFNCQTSGAPLYVSVVSDVDEYGEIIYSLKHISGSSSSGAPIMFIAAGEFKTLDAVYIPDSFATKDYVETQIRTAQKEVKYISAATIDVLEPNKIYIHTDGRLSNLNISSLTTTTNPIDEYTLHFVTRGAGLVSLPDYVKWANGEKITLAGGAVYELSIVKTTISGTDYFKAVLTRFA